MKTKIQKIYRTVYNSIANGDSLKKFRAILVREINECYPRATPSEKLSMYKSALKLRNTGDKRENLERIIKAENLILRNEDARARMSGLKEQVKENREKPEPVIFYLCSHHANPAEDHEFWEAKIYVDRFWRITVQGIYSDEQIKKIETYIKDNGIYTVQWVTGFPVYLLSRPYCRHYMIPVQTSEVLGNSLKDIRKNHPEGVMWYRALDPKDREKRFQDKRRLVGTVMRETNKKVDAWLGDKPYAYSVGKKIKTG